MPHLPLTISPALRLRVGDAQVDLSPRQAFSAAELLIRTATRRAMREEVLDLDRPARLRAVRPKVTAR